MFFDGSFWYILCMVGFCVW